MDPPTTKRFKSKGHVNAVGCTTENKKQSPDGAIQIPGHLKDSGKNISFACRADVLTKEIKMFDVYEDSYQGFRIATNVTKEWLDHYCNERGLTVTREHRRGVVYFDAFVKRV